MPGTWFKMTMPQCSWTHLLTRFVEQAKLSESGQPLVICGGMPKTCHYFIYDPLRRACPNDVAYIDPLIVACYMGMSRVLSRI